MTLSMADSLWTFLGRGDGRGRGFLPVVQQSHPAGLPAPPPSPWKDTNQHGQRRQACWRAGRRDGATDTTAVPTTAATQE